MGKKKKHAKKNKIRSEKIKKIDDEIYLKKLMELEDVIYTYREKELLTYFLDEFKYGKKKDCYKKSVSLLYDLNIECLEFAISRFHNIDVVRDPARFFTFITPFITAYITTAFKIYEDTRVFTVVWAGALIPVVMSLYKIRKDRIISGTMLKTFEQVHARKLNEKE